MAIVSSKLSSIQAGLRPLLDFLNHSEHAKRSGDPTICDFVFGNPQEMPLGGLVEAIRRHATPETKDWFAYTTRIPGAVEAIAASLRERTALPFQAADVCLAPGTFAALASALRATVDPGDEVVFVSPPWFFYESMIAVAGGRPVRVSLSGPSFALDAGRVEAAISARTRAVIINTPHNPTGRIYTRDELDALAAVLARASSRTGRPIVLLSDESYYRIVFDGGVHVSPAVAYPHTLVLYTYGKQLLAPGERVGYVAVSPEAEGRDELRNALVFSQIVGGWQFPNTTLQRAVPDLEQLSIDIGALERRRDRMYEALTNLGYETTKPEATFYMMVRSPIADDRAFTSRLARHNVFVGPGHIFEMPGYFRISLTASDEMVSRGLDGFARALAETPRG
jgi:aspartate aminotransferase